jgi:hypothetical protein
VIKLNNLRIVTRDQEVELLNVLSSDASDTEVIRMAENRLDTSLKGYQVSRNGNNVLVAPTPVFG